MLVCCSMEYVIRSESTENILHESLVRDACNDGLAGEVGKIACHHTSNIVHRCFGLVNKNQFSICDEYAAFIQLPADCLHIYNYLVTRKKVFDVHFVQLIIAKFALSVPFFCRGG